MIELFRWKADIHGNHVSDGSVVFFWPCWLTAYLFATRKTCNSEKFCILFNSYLESLSLFLFTTAAMVLLSWLTAESVFCSRRTLHKIACGCEQLRSLPIWCHPRFYSPMEIPSSLTPCQSSVPPFFERAHISPASVSNWHSLVYHRPSVEVAVHAAEWGRIGFGMHQTYQQGITEKLKGGREAAQFLEKVAAARLSQKLLV